MRREREINKFFVISIVIVSVLIISLIAFLISRSSRRASENQFADEMSSASTQMGKTVEESEDEEDYAEFEEVELEEESEENLSNTANTVEETSSNIIENETKDSNTNKSDKKEKNTSNKTQSTNAEPEKKEVKMDFEAPVKGQVLREFAKDSLVFSNTLQEWITHNGVDIKADKTSVVKAVASGTVYAIKEDPRYGLTVIINHDNGYQTIYSNLLTAEFVVKGEKVEKGQSIGTVGNTASFESADECHLHFELLKDNEYLDPVIYMDFE